MKQVYLTLTNRIKNLTKEQYNLLKEMCEYSNNLYNYALYNVRQYYFNEKKFLTYESNYHVCKENENYKLLQAGVAQQTLKVVDRSFKSFFNLIKKAKTGEYRFQDVKIPHYQEKGSVYPLILSTNAISIKDGYFKIPMSREFSKLHPKQEIKIKFPIHIADKKIKEVRILPINKCQFFKIQYVYEQEVENQNLDNDNWLSIDIGLENFATCVSNTNAPFIIDGRKLKSINQYWNKEKARLQAIKDKQGIKGNTKKINAITLNRNFKTKDYINKSVRYIINYCIENNIGKVICGYNADFKRNINISKITNKQFTQISFGDFRETLTNLCERYGIEYIEQEESYTSKASFLDLDDIPTFNPNDETKYSFSGKRVKRGLYQSKNNIKINADVNGALNIMRKSKQKFDYEQLCKRLLNSPVRIRIA